MRKKVVDTELAQLSDKQIDSFNKNGFLLLDTDISEPTINRAIDDMGLLLPEKSEWRPGIRVQDGWQQSEAVYEIATKVSILSWLEQLFGRPAKPFQTLNFSVGTQQRIHSDTIHFNSIPSGFMAGAWVALEQVTLDNGPLIYYPGSHLLQEYNMQDIGLEPGYSNYKFYEDFIEKLMSESEIEPTLAEMEKGQVLIWHANLIHGGSKRTDSLSTRHSQVTHYFFEDCKYYTPMNSSPEHIDWRQPLWINKDKPGAFQQTSSQIKRYLKGLRNIKNK